MIETEEATKTAFVVQFISNVLGYDVFDPSEVVAQLPAMLGLSVARKSITRSLKMGKSRS